MIRCTASLKSTFLPRPSLSITPVATPPLAAKLQVCSRTFVFPSPKYNLLRPRIRTMASASSSSSSKIVPNMDKAVVPDLNADRVSLLQKHGITITAIHPLGAKVKGVDLRPPVSPPKEVIDALQLEMAGRGFLVFEEQGVMTAEEQIRASELWGGQEMHSTHGVHPAAPHRHIFRLSNDREHGILGVGPQWHNDGSFEVGVFSHVGYHIVRVPEKGGDTMFAHQGAAFEALPDDKQRFWETLVSVNSNSGVLHPVVHEHPISKRKSVYLHLGMTGAVLSVTPENEEKPIRLLNQEEMMTLFNDYNDLLNAGIDQGGKYSISYNYQEGDCIFIDNLAVAHRASPKAHMAASQQGLRILHRTTVKAMQPFLPPFGMPPAINIHTPNPFGEGVWQGGGLGFRWDPDIHMQN